MAISTAFGKRIGEKQAASKRVAESARRAQKKAKKRGFFSKLLSGAGGKLLGGALTGFLNLSGIGAPIGMALGNMLAKKGAFEATRGMAPKARDIQAGGKYGYGEEEAQTLREGLIQQQEALEGGGPGAFGKELLSSYISAGMSGELKGTLKDLGKGGEGLFKKGYGITGGAGLKGRLKSAGEGFKGHWEDVTSWGGKEKEGVVGEEELVYSPLHPKPADIPTEELIEDPVYTGLLFEQPQDPIPRTPGPWALPEEEEVNIMQQQDQGFTYPAEKHEQGGMVSKKSTTIADYFDMKGVSLGGSNKHSLAEMLGRK